ncbi:MAG: radical SAM protein [Polyangiaceae bacterium]
MLLLVTSRLRQRGALPPALDEALPDPPLGTLRDLLASIDGPVWLAGGEPTLRPDLPELIAAAATDRGGVGLVTDGLALTRPEVVEPLVAAGLSQARLWIHAARADAHDWLVGRPGALRLTLRASKTLASFGVEQELEAVVTRPTMPYLVELVALALELGIGHLHLHRLPTQPADVALTPRFGLLEPHLEHIAWEARRAGLALDFHDFPRCVVGAAEDNRVEAPERIHTPWPSVVTHEPTVPGCGDCQDDDRTPCRGAPAGYVARFGRDEFPAEAIVPATRLRAVKARAEGAPAIVARPRAEALRVRFGGPARVACPICGDHDLALPHPEPTRAIRQRLVRAAHQGAGRLRVADGLSLSHPAAGAMLRECLLLFPEVEVAGEASGLATMEAADLYHLEGLTRVDAALYGPDAASHDAHVGREGAFEATHSGLARLHEATGVPIGLYAVVHDAETADAFRRAWAEGLLDGTPRFRWLAGRPAGEPRDEQPAGVFFGDDLDPSAPASGSDLHAMLEARDG